MSIPDSADIDRHFSTFIQRFGGGQLLARAAAGLAAAIRAGHVCLDLNHPPDAERADWPSLPAWRAALAENTACGGPDEGRPLVLDAAGRLYLRRYWEYQENLAQAILQRCPVAAPPVSTTEDAQTLAVETARQRLFTIISGGPGTGKTTTVLRILERLVAEADGARLRIALSAPTGKAAARLQEALREATPALQQSLLGPAATLNRLLGAIPGSVYFRHGKDHPLAADVLVIDEASMVPLAMMAKVFAALLPQTRVILLGDRDQLASVEAGAVLGDLAEAAQPAGSALHGSLVRLEKNYRFSEDSGISRLCRAVCAGEADQALSVLQNADETGLSAHEVPDARHLLERLREPLRAGFAHYLQTKDPAEALARFKSFRVLCALRVGPFGSVHLNRQIQEILAAAGLIERAPGIYRGLPVLITRNDYDLGLFNGDVGLILPEATGSTRLVAWFTAADGSLRPVAPARLPDYEPAFAMTVHKSQGSEFENVLLLLPAEESPVLSRELVYTGLTRARKQVDVWFREPALRAAIKRRTQRFSGLRDRLLAALDQA